MRIDELMTSPIVTCQSNETLEAAARELWDRDCGALAIVNDQGHLVGMLTDRDICMGALMQGKPLADIPIHTAMSQTVYAVTRDSSLAEVEALMADQQIRRVPVVDDERRPIGVITVNDLVAAATAPSPRIADRRVMATLAAIGAHRTIVDRAA